MRVLLVLAVLAVGFLQCTSATKSLSSVLKSRLARSPNKKYEETLVDRKRTRRQVSTQCHQDLVATTMFQNFSSSTSGMGGLYLNDMHCSWKIQAPANKVIILRFPKFSVEGIAGCAFDSVEVNDTQGQISPPLCGTGPNCTGNFPTKEITAGNTMIVSLSTDFGITYPGFTAQYRYAEPPYQAQNFNTTNFTSSCSLDFYNNSSTEPKPPVVRNCSMVLTTGSSIKQFVFNYTNNMRCQWNISTVDPLQRVAIRFKRFSVEGISTCLYDYATVNDSQGELSGRLCGQGINCTGKFPRQVYVSRGGNVTVGFVSDASIILGGFVLEYYGVGPLYVAENFTTIENVTSSCNATEVYENRTNTNVFSNNTEAFQAYCSSNLTATTSFQSFNLTTQPFYHNNARCLFNITAPEGKVIVFRFTRFDVEFGNNCIYDRVTVINSTGPSSLFCGNTAECPGQFPTKELVSSTTRLLVTFISDGSVIGEGFEAQFKFVDPGYTGQEFITRGSANASMCRNETANPTPPARVWPCMLNLNATSSVQVFRSPAISDTNPHYPNNVQCMWNISAPNGVVKLSFQTFDIEAASGCNYDKVRVSDQQGQLTAPMCGQGFGCIGNYPQMELISRGPNMVVQLQSDGSVNFAGFTATYTIADAAYTAKNISREVVGNRNVTCDNNPQRVPQRSQPCISHLRATETPQTLISHDTENSRTYPDNMICIWNITAPPNKNVLIRFIYFDLEGDSTCSYDSVTLTSGREMVQRFCGNGLHCSGHFPIQEYMSDHNNLTMTFRSDASIHFSGFEAEYLYVDQSYQVQPHLADENTTFTNVECNSCPDYLFHLPLGTSFGMPRGPGHDVYQHNLNCQWELNTNSSDVGNLTLLHYDIEESTGCSADALVLRGQDLEETRLCGRSEQPRSFLFTGSLFVAFDTNAAVARTGFEAIFQAVHAVTPRKRRSLSRLFRKKRNHSS